MPKSKLIGLLYESWKDFDRVLDGLTAEQVLARPNNESSFAWTLAHVTNHVDRWMGYPHQPLLNRTTHEWFRVRAVSY